MLRRCQLKQGSGSVGGGRGTDGQKIICELCQSTFSGVVRREPFCGVLKKRLVYETRVGRQLVADVGLKDGFVFDGRCVYEIEKPVRRGDARSDDGGSRS